MVPEAEQASKPVMTEAIAEALRELGYLDEDSDGEAPKSGTGVADPEVLSEGDAPNALVYAVSPNGQAVSDDRVRAVELQDEAVLSLEPTREGGVFITERQKALPVPGPELVLHDHLALPTLEAPESAPGRHSAGRGSASAAPSLPSSSTGARSTPNVDLGVAPAKGGASVQPIGGKTRGRKVALTSGPS